MPGTPLDIVGKQLENAAKNRLRTERAGLLRHASIARHVNARLGEAQQSVQKKGKRRETRRSGVYMQENPAMVAPDGYVRRSPVQEIRVEPGYTKKRIKKAIGVAILLLLLAGTAALLMQYVAI